jgi:hypothetical protein
MTNLEVQQVVKSAERRGLEGLDRARFILDAGVTIDEYRCFERRRTHRWLVICAVSLAACIAGCRWLVRVCTGG